MLKRLFTPIALSGALIATLTVASPASATGVNGNPWGYNFVPGKLIYTPTPPSATGATFTAFPTSHAAKAMSSSAAMACTVKVEATLAVVPSITAIGVSSTHTSHYASQSRMSEQLAVMTTPSSLS